MAFLPSFANLGQLVNVSFGRNNALALLITANLRAHYGPTKYCACSQKKLTAGEFISAFIIKGC